MGRIEWHRQEDDAEVFERLAIAKMAKAEARAAKNTVAEAKIDEKIAALTTKLAAKG